MNNIKDIIYISLFIITFCLFMRKNNLEKFTDLTVENVRKIIKGEYKVDADSIRNLTNVSKKLQKEGLTVPGDLKIKGNLTVDNNLSVMNDLYVKNYTSSKNLDVRNSESVEGRWNTAFNWANTGDNYIRGKLQTDQGEIRFNGNIFSTGSFTTDSYITAKGDINAGDNLTLSNSNTKFIIHNPNDARPQLYFAKGKGNGSDWNWAQSINFNGDTGTLQIPNTKVDKTLTIGGSASRHGKTVGATSFNYNNDGRNFIHGDTIIRPQKYNKNYLWAVHNWKQYLQDLGAIKGDRSYVISDWDGWKFPMELSRTTGNYRAHNTPWKKTYTDNLLSMSRHADHHHAI